MVIKTIKADVTDVQAKPAGAPAADTAGLDALLQEAAQSEQATAQATQAQEAKQDKAEVDTLAADLLDALNMAAAPAKPAMWWLTESEFETYWGPKVRQGIAESGAEIMRRNGLSLGGLMSQYGPYVALFGALAPSVVGTVSIYKQKQKAIAGGPDGGSSKAG